MRNLRGHKSPKIKHKLLLFISIDFSDCFVQAMSQIVTYWKVTQKESTWQSDSPLSLKCSPCALPHSSCTGVHWCCGFSGLVHLTQANSKVQFLPGTTPWTPSLQLFLNQNEMLVKFTGSGCSTENESAWTLRLLEKALTQIAACKPVPIPVSILRAFWHLRNV